MDKNIFRVEKNANYVVMSRAALNDERLSWKAKGLHSYMLSMPDDWKFYNEELSKHSSDGLSVIKSAIKELKECGYIKRMSIKDDKGKIINWETVVYEISQSPEVENPPCGESTEWENHKVENRPLLNTDLSLNTNLLLNNDLKEDIEASEWLEEVPNEPIPFTSQAESYKEIISYLNEKTDNKYKHTTPKTQTLIKARLSEGFTLEDFKKVIDVKTDQWLKDSEMYKFLRPNTLFGTKFEAYLNEFGKTPKGDSYDWNRKGNQPPADEFDELSF